MYWYTCTVYVLIDKSHRYTCMCSEQHMYMCTTHKYTCTEYPCSVTPVITYIYYWALGGIDIDRFCFLITLQGTVIKINLFCSILSHTFIHLSYKSPEIASVYWFFSQKFRSIIRREGFTIIKKKLCWKFKAFINYSLSFVISQGTDPEDTSGDLWWPSACGGEVYEACVLCRSRADGRVLSPD